MSWNFGAKKVWSENQHARIWLQFWGVSIGDWHVGVQRWGIERKVSGDGRRAEHGSIQMEEYITWEERE